MSWRIEFATATTDQTVDTFECEIDKLSRYISKTGTLSGSIPVISPELGKRISSVLGGEGRLTMYAYFGDECWWGGFLDRTALKSNAFGALLTFEGSTFESYPDRRELRTDKEYKSIEQTEYARMVWDYMQSTGDGSNLRIDTSFRPVVSVKRDLSWKRSEARTVGSLLKEVSNRVGGFEWIIDCYTEGFIRYRDLVVGYPQIGRPETGMVLTYPGDIMEYEIDGDAMDGATSFQARGKAPDPVGSPGNSKGVYDPVTGKTTVTGDTPKGSERTEPIMSAEYHATALLRKGYVRTDATVERDTVTQVSTLNAWAELARDMRSGPLVLPAVLTRMGPLNQAVLGSDVMLRISDHPFPPGPNGEPGYEYTARCIGYEINPGEYGAPDLARIIFENPYDEDAMKRIPA